MSILKVRFFIITSAITLVLGAPTSLRAVVDVNEDGISDVWQSVHKAYGLVWDEDLDGDGFDNEEESILGTDPRDAASSLVLGAPTYLTANTLQLQWPAVAGKRYQVQLSSDLEQWEDWGAPVLASSELGELLWAVDDFILGDLRAFRYDFGEPTSLSNARSWIEGGASPDAASHELLLDFPQTDEDIDYFCRWVRGWLVPPADGDYTFWIAGDDLCELWLSDGPDEDNAVLIAATTAWTGYQEWDKYPDDQQSEPMALLGGVPYYFEVFALEYSGGDSVSVAWTGPGLHADKELLSAQYVTQSVETLSEKDGALFFKVEVEDVDSDKDTVSDAEEYVVGFDPFDATTSPLIEDGPEVVSILEAPNVISVGSAVARAYEAEGTAGVFRFFRSGNIDPVRVFYSVAGTAGEEDYEPLLGSLIIPGGANQVDVPVLPEADGLFESAETVVLSITGEVSYEVGSPAEATVTIDDAADRLFIATLRPPTGVDSGAYGYAVMRVKGNAEFTRISVEFAGLAGNQLDAELYLSSADEDAVLLLPVGQVDSMVWDFSSTVQPDRDMIIEGLESGELFIRMASDRFADGELLGQFVETSGSTSLLLPEEPPAAPTAPVAEAEAARFLTQATFGVSEEAMAELMLGSYEAWIDAQMALPATAHLPLMQQRRQEYFDEGNASGGYQAPRQEAWWQHALTAPDQLRQRVAFALSEIFVISQIGALSDTQEGTTHYYDQLVSYAFGNYRDLLEVVTKHPMMGIYLSMARNQKPNPDTGQEPDENYAREVMQLFSMGLQELHLDGTLQLDEQGWPIPTYDQEDIVALARVFTGWGPPYDAADPPENVESYYLYNSLGWELPMSFYEDFHDSDEKVIVGDVTIAAATDGEVAMEQALDAIANHDNVGPFMALRLIQRLVTSNPSPGYVYRVASVFNDNGEGVRGDLGAVVKAILLDYEARSADVIDTVSYGKQREPLLRATHMLRAFMPEPPLFASTGDEHYYLNLQYSLTQQAPLLAASVFNFFQSGYRSPGPIADAGLMSPEFQITSETTTVAMSNWHYQALFWGVGTSALDPVQDPDTPYIDYLSIYLDLEDEVALLLREEFTELENLEALIDHLDVLLLNGALSDALRAEIVAAYEAFPSWFREGEEYRSDQVKMVIFLMMVAPEYAIAR